MNVIDVGANIGFFTMLASRLVGEEGKVIAFEPNSERATAAARHRTQSDVQHPADSGRPVEQHGRPRCFRPYGIERRLSAKPCRGFAKLAMHRGANLPHGSTGSRSRRSDQAGRRGAEGLVLEGARSLVESYRPVSRPNSCPKCCRAFPGPTHGTIAFFADRGYRVFLLDRQNPDGEGLAVPTSTPSSQITGSAPGSRTWRSFLRRIKRSDVFWPSLHLTAQP